MSKHVKALRGHAAGTAVTMFPRGDLLDAADHMESLERQLRIAKRALRDIDPWCAGPTEKIIDEAKAAMRKAAKKARK